MTIALPRPAWLADVRLDALMAVKASLRARSPGTEPVIAFAEHRGFGVGQRQEGTVTLAVAATPLTWTERCVIRQAYRFRPRGRGKAMPTGEALLGELVSDAVADFARADIAAFGERCDVVGDTLGLLLRLSSRRFPESALPHAGELSGSGWFTLSGTWARTLFPLCERTAEALPASARAFEHVANLPVRVSAQAGQRVVPSALALTDDLLNVLAHQLLHRWEDAVQAGGAAAPASGPPAAAAGWYDEAWVALSGAWGSLGHDRWPREGKATDHAATWATLHEHIRPLLSHLWNTTRLVAKAAAIGDLVGGGRALDLLLRWPDAWRYRRDGPMSWIVRDRDVSPRVLLDARWDSVAASVPGLPPGLVPAPEDVFVSAFRAAWRAHCIDLALVLLSWAEPAGPKSPAATLAGRLISGTLSDPAEPGHAPDDRERPIVPAPLLNALARAGGEGFRSPGPLSSDTLRRLLELAEPRRVSGIVYSGSAGLPHATFRRRVEILLVAAALRARAHDLPITLDVPWLTRDQAAVAVTARFFGEAAEGIGNLPPPALRPLLRVVAERPEASDEEVDAAAASASEWCRMIEERLSEAAERLAADRARAIIAAPIDPSRLAAIGAAAALAFDRDKAEPPVSLFAAVERTGEPLPLPVGIITSHDRARLTKPLYDTVESDEADWWAETMRGQMAASVMGQLSHRAGARVSVESPEAWRDALTAWRARLGDQDGCPVLLFGHDWPWYGGNDLEAAIATRLRHAGADELVRARTPFLDGVTIARLPFASPTLLAPATLFRLLSFGVGSDGSPVAVTFEPSDADPTTGRLTVAGSLAIDLDRPERALVIEARRPAD